MAARKTQEELEQPAKNYQIEALETQFKSFSTEVRTNFVTVNQNIQTLINQSQSQISPQTFQENLSALKTSLETKVDEEIEKVQLKYDPIRDNNKWLLRAVGGQAIVLVAQVIFILYVTRSAS